VRRSLKDGLLGDASNVRAARTKAGPFEPLRGYPEFRDLVIEAAPLSVPQPSTPRRASASDETIVAPKNSNQETTPAVPRKPSISPDALPSSRRKEVLKWLCFFALFVLAAAIAFWFFGRLP
jgi:hypothetical protein